MSKETGESIAPKAQKQKGLLDGFFQKNNDATEKENKPGTVISRAFDTLISKMRKSDKKKAVKEEIKKAIVDIKNETLPKKPYDLKAAMQHFQSLHPEIKDALVQHFDTYFPGDVRGPYNLYDAIYRFQKDAGISADAIAGQQTRAKISENNPKFLPSFQINPTGTTNAGEDVLNTKVD